MSVWQRHVRCRGSRGAHVSYLRLDLCDSVLIVSCVLKKVWAEDLGHCRDVEKGSHSAQGGSHATNTGLLLVAEWFLPAYLENSSKKCVNKREEKPYDLEGIGMIVLSSMSHKVLLRVTVQVDTTITTGGKGQRSAAVVSSCEGFTPARSVTEYCRLAQGGEEMVKGR